MLDLPSVPVCTRAVDGDVRGPEHAVRSGTPAGTMKPLNTMVAASPVAVFLAGMFNTTVLRGVGGLPSGPGP